MEIKGLTKDNIIKISTHKKEEVWVKDYRIKSYEYFEKMNKDLPFGPKFKLNFDDIIYYKSATDELTDDWSKVMKPINPPLPKRPRSARHISQGSPQACGRISDR